MRLLTGDECGLLKESIPEMGRPKRSEHGPVNQAFPITTRGIQRINVHYDNKQERARGIMSMCFTTTEASLLEFAVLRVDSSVQWWKRAVNNDKNKSDHQHQFHLYNQTASCSNIFSNDDTDSKHQEQQQLPPSRPLGLGVIDDRICAVDSIGRISILQNDNRQDDNDAAQVVSTYSAFNLANTRISYTKGQYENKHICTAMTVLPGNVVVSGRERETCMIDLRTGRICWRAKNLPPDPQTLLQQPVWTTALCSMTQDSASSSCYGHLLAAGTAYHQVRLYDVRSDSTSAQRRPVLYTTEKDKNNLMEHRITALCQLDSNTLAVGDAAGFLYSLDIRMMQDRNRQRKSMSMGRFVGPCGSIRQLAKHPTAHKLACVGLDRMLRIFDTQNRKQLDCIYLKQRVNSVLFCPDDDKLGEDGTDVGAEDYVQDYIDSSDEEEQMLRQRQRQNRVSQESGDNNHDDKDEEESDDEEESSSSGQDDSGDPEEEDEIVESKSKRRRT